MKRFVNCKFCFIDAFHKKVTNMRFSRYLLTWRNGQIDVKKWRRIKGLECRFEVRRTLEVKIIKLWAKNEKNTLLGASEIFTN